MARLVQRHAPGVGPVEQPPRCVHRQRLEAARVSHLEGRAAQRGAKFALLLVLAWVLVVVVVVLAFEVAGREASPQSWRLGTAAIVRL